MTTSVVLAEDTLLMREGIRAVLALEDDIELVAEVGTYDDLLVAVDEHRPDVVLTDIRMPPSQTDEGIRAANEITERHRGTGVVVLSQYVEPAYATHLFASGSEGRGYLLKERVGHPGELGVAIRRVAEGGSMVDPRVVDALMQTRSGADDDPLAELSDREREVLAEMASGASNIAIGERLHISPRSVEKHVASIFVKLQLEQSPETNRRVQAVLVHLGARS
ncbi:MAG: LuxR C-terminal-related transcriptional regulator [Microthrixaceae bacterium]